MTKYNIDYTKSFNTYREAFSFYKENEGKTALDSYMALLSEHGKHSVIVRKIDRYDGKSIRIVSTGQPIFGFGSDVLGDGVKGILNHVDGKHYDSKSEYTKAVHRSGNRIVGNDLNNKEFRRQLRGDFNIKPQFREAVQKAIQQGKL